MANFVSYEEVQIPARIDPNVAYVVTPQPTYDWQVFARSEGMYDDPLAYLSYLKTYYPDKKFRVVEYDTITALPGEKFTDTDSPVLITVTKSFEKWTTSEKIALVLGVTAIIYMWVKNGRR